MKYISYVSPKTYSDNLNSDNQIVMTISFIIICIRHYSDNDHKFNLYRLKKFKTCPGSKEVQKLNRFKNRFKTCTGSKEVQNLNRFKKRFKNWTSPFEPFFEPVQFFEPLFCFEPVQKKEKGFWTGSKVRTSFPTCKPNNVRFSNKKARSV